MVILGASCWGSHAFVAGDIYTVSKWKVWRWGEYWDGLEGGGGCKYMIFGHRMRGGKKIGEDWWLSLVCRVRRERAVRKWGRGGKYWLGCMSCIMAMRRGRR